MICNKLFNRTEFPSQEININDRYIAKYMSIKYFGKLTDNSFIGALGEILLQDIFMKNNITLLSYPRGEYDDFLGKDVFIVNGQYKNQAADIKCGFIKADNYDKIFIYKENYRKDNELFFLTFIIKNENESVEDSLHFVGAIKFKEVMKLPTMIFDGKRIYYFHGK